jgi:hypothetical protein
MKCDAPQAIQEKRPFESRAVRESKTAEIQALIRKEGEELGSMAPAEPVDKPLKARSILNNPEEMFALILFLLFILWIVKA